MKRLAASVAGAGRENGFAPKRREAIVLQAVGEYRWAIREFAGMRTLDVWYARASVGDLKEMLRSQASKREIRRFEETIESGRRKDSARAFAKLAFSGNGDPRTAADPPLIVPIDELIGQPDVGRLESATGATQAIPCFFRPKKQSARYSSDSLESPRSETRGSEWS